MMDVDGYTSICAAAKVKVCRSPRPAIRDVQYKRFSIPERTKGRFSPRPGYVRKLLVQSSPQIERNYVGLDPGRQQSRGKGN